MKTAAWILALTVVALGACTSQQKSTGFVNDEVYNSPVSTASVAEPAGQQGAQVIENPDKATSQKPPASSTFEEDYNDYSYASRIKRFGGKDTTAGYFDESYAGGSSSGSGPNVSFNFGIGTGFISDNDNRHRPGLLGAIGEPFVRDRLHSGEDVFLAGFFRLDAANRFHHVFNFIYGIGRDDGCFFAERGDGGLQRLI